MLVPLVVVMACAAGHIDPVEGLLNMPFVCKFDILKQEVLFKEVFDTVAS